MFDLRYPVVVVVALHPRFFLKPQIPTIFFILIHISHTTTIKMVIIFLFLLPILFFLTYIPHYHPLIFQLIYSPNRHHKFNFFITIYSLLLFSEDQDTFYEGKGTISTLNMVNVLLFSQLGRNCLHRWQLDLSSEFYPYMEFQNSKLDGVGFVGKITLPSTTSMKGPSLNYVFFRSKNP